MVELTFVIGFFIAVGVVGLDLNSGGTKCGQIYCSSIEYCSPFDTQCRPCSTICNTSHHNHDSATCAKDCQQYLHDQRYALRVDLDRDGNLRDEELRAHIYKIDEYDPDVIHDPTNSHKKLPRQPDDLKRNDPCPDLQPQLYPLLPCIVPRQEEVVRLSTLVKVSLALTIAVILVLIFLLMKTFLKVKKIREALIKIFGKKWVKKNTNNDNVRNDVETGGGAAKSQQQNNTRLIMPTISGRVAPSSQSSNECSTTNTSCTTLSRREATEDNTLDFAYDNPAMTPSPDTTVQLKSKRESAF